LASNGKTSAAEKQHIIDPGVFALHAGDDLDIWRAIEGQHATHNKNERGVGTVVEVVRGSDGLLIWVCFDEASNDRRHLRFGSESFINEQHFRELTLPDSLFQQIEPILPYLETKLRIMRSANSPTDPIKLAWSLLESGFFIDWKRLPQSEKILSVYRAAKENKVLANWETMQENVDDSLVKCVLLLLWAKANQDKSGNAFKKAHEFFQEYVVQRAWDLSEPLRLDPLLPLCRSHVVRYCEGRPWRTDEEQAADSPRASRAFCPREGYPCALLGDVRDVRTGGFDEAPRKLSGARLYPDRSRPWKDWSLLELLQACNVVPELEGLQNPDEYVPKLAGWANRLNEIRERLKCSVCGRMMTPNVTYAKFLAKFNVTVVSCQYGDSHDKDVYLNECWACGQVIDSRESKIRKDGYYVCIHCGSGPQQSDDYTQGDICPNCGALGMVPASNHSRTRVCHSCNHTIRLPQERKLTGTQSKQKGRTVT
jgi:hypothetical protein